MKAAKAAKSTERLNILKEKVPEAKVIEKKVEKPIEKPVEKPVETPKNAINYKILTKD